MIRSAVPHIKRVSILGSTGSIGTSTLDVIRRSNGQLVVEAIAAGRNVDLIVAQAGEFHPSLISVADSATQQAVTRSLAGLGLSTRVVASAEGHCEVALSDCEILVSAMSGTHGLIPTFRAIEAGKDIALANKEILVSAGEIVTRTAAQHQVRLLPVDSEHSALFQCLYGQSRIALKALHLTASGGPFRNLSNEGFSAITPEQALDHPTWKMGRKVTIDSATMMNKGLEVIEAHWLFHVPAEQIRVLVHPQSIVHSLVEFRDGSWLAQLGVSDMRIPISYALYYPERMSSSPAVLDLAQLGQLTFEPVDVEKFRCLPLAFAALKSGGIHPLLLNVMNEEAVQNFLDRRIRLSEIPTAIEAFLDNHSSVPLPEKIEDIAILSSEMHIKAKELLKSKFKL